MYKPPVARRALGCLNDKPGILATARGIAASRRRSTFLRGASTLTTPGRLVRRERLQRILLDGEHVLGDRSVGPLTGRRLAVKLLIR